MCKKNLKSKSRKFLLQSLIVYINIFNLMKEKLKKKKNVSQKENQNVEKNSAMQQNLPFLGNMIEQEQLDTFSLDLETYYDTFESFYQDKHTESDTETLETPVSSYTSSDFFINKSEEEETVDAENNNTENSKVFSNLSVTFDDDEFKDEPLDLTKEKNLVMHVMSNLKFGMDLESIPLPAFILESRSLLEMHAEMYSFSELFVQIPDGSTEYERFKRVVKWYLSTFQARLVPKKPYNPILGEVFQCLYETNDSDENFKSKNSLNGPIPWAKSSQLNFFAQQVSHHPPITAFYLENANKGIQLDGFVKSVSKFYGLTVGVESIGNSVISLMQHNEEYVFTFPASFVRSIFTVPWLEISGKVNISCKKSGYSAQINFLPKPFYAGKKHQIEGSIFSPDKKLFDKLYGDWTETVYIQTSSNIEIFFEVNSSNRYKKKVRKIIDQEENESRKVWQEVTKHLRNKQCDLANKAKIQIERKQREEVIRRKNNNTEWKSKYFHFSDNRWSFNEPLKERNNI